MPFLMSFSLEHEIVTFSWIDNASVQFPLNFYATKGFNLSRMALSVLGEAGERIGGIAVFRAGRQLGRGKRLMAPIHRLARLCDAKKSNVHV